MTHPIFLRTLLSSLLFSLFTIFTLFPMHSLNAGEIESAILEASAGLEPIPANLEVVAERLRARGYQSEMVIHGRAGFDKGKDKITVNGVTYDIIYAAGSGVNSKWQALPIERKSNEPSPAVEGAIRGAFAGLPAVPASLDKVVETLKAKGFQAEVVIDGTAQFPRGKDQIKVNGLVYDIIQGASGGNGSWQTLFVGGESTKGAGGSGGPSGINEVVKGASSSGVSIRILESAIKLAWRDLPPTDAGLKSALERLVSSGLKATHVVGTHDKIILEGNKFDIMSESGGPKAQWSIIYLGAGTDSGKPKGPESGPGGGKPSGDRVPLPNMKHIIQEVANDMPGDIQNGDPRHGGNWNFLDECVKRLRKADPRFGFNWKRGKVGDASHDCVSYYFGPGEPVQDSNQVYVIDMISSSQSPEAKPSWHDATDYEFKVDGGWSPHR